MPRPEKGGLWCFYDKRGGKEHIILDDFINRYLSGTIIGVGGYYEDGTASSITFSRKDLLKPSKDFSDFCLKYKQTQDLIIKGQMIQVKRQLTVYLSLLMKFWFPEMIHLI